MGPIFLVFGASVFFLCLLTVIASGFIVWSLESDAPGWATFVVTTALIVLYFFTDFGIRYHINLDWRLFFTLAILYIVIGVAWSLLKWYIDLIARRELWKEAEDTYRERNNISSVTPVSKKDEKFAQFLQKNHKYETFIFDGTSYGYKITVRPKPNKSRNIARMIYWPWSVFWSLLDDFVMGIFKFIYRHISGAYDRMARHVFRGLED